MLLCWNFELVFIEFLCVCVVCGVFELIGRYGHDGYSDPYGASTPHPYDHSPFQTVPQIGGPADPWVPPNDIANHHSAMQAQVTERTQRKPMKSAT